MSLSMTKMENEILMPEIPMTRDDLEDIMQCRVFDWQWERVQEFFQNGVIRIGINKEDLTTDRPDLISEMTEVIRTNMGEWLTKEKRIQTLREE